MGVLFFLQHWFSSSFPSRSLFTYTGQRSLSLSGNSYAFSPEATFSPPNVDYRVPWRSYVCWQDFPSLPSFKTSLNVTVKQLSFIFFFPAWDNLSINFRLFFLLLQLVIRTPPHNMATRTVWIHDHAAYSYVLILLRLKAEQNLSILRLPTIRLIWTFTFSTSNRTQLLVVQISLEYIVTESGKVNMLKKNYERILLSISHECKLFLIFLCNWNGKK